MLKESEIYAKTILTEKDHRRIVQDLDGFAYQAGVPRYMIYTSLADLATEAEVGWVKTLPSRLEQGPFGVAYVGRFDSPPLEIRLPAAMGACVRNYIDGRVMTLQNVLDRLKDNQPPTCSVLAIPNFFVDKDEGGHVPAWQKSYLYGMLMDRMLSSKVTVLGIQNMAAMEDQYGSTFKSCIRDHYQIVKGA